MKNSEKQNSKRKSGVLIKFRGYCLSCLRSVAVLSGYMFCFALAYWLAFAFRFDFNLNDKSFALCYSSMVWVLPFKAAIFFWHRHFSYNYSFFATFKDVQVLAKSSLVSAISIFVLAHYCFNVNLPKTVPVLDCIFTFFLIGAVRYGWRAFHQELLPRLTKRPYRKTLIIGANYQGAALAHEIFSHPTLGYRIIGFISIHSKKVGQLIGHLPVLGHIDELEAILNRCCIQEVLTFPEILSGNEMRSVMTLCQRRKIRIRIVPSMESRLGNENVPMRDIKIEDLLKRQPIQLDDLVIKTLVTDQAVLVTGAGGSIGSEICRQIVKYRPKALYILGRGENRIFFLEQELRRLGFKGELIPIIADVSSRERMEQVFRDMVPNVVFHAAAHKHVPLMEANVSEAIHNNIIGTKTVSDLSNEHGVSTFVLISTDKAVNPTSIMGASKHMAERYVHALSRKSKTKFIVTRFGNVLGSNGSVVPLFQRQIARGGPITVTDFRMTRYFMTIPEASQLVLQAAAMGMGGEIFVLDMGEPVRILDLAKDLVRLSGLPENAIEICETGMRPGEKLYEELYFDSEKAIRTSHPKLRCATHRRFDLKSVEEQIRRLQAIRNNHPEMIRTLLQEMIEEYQPYTVSSPSATDSSMLIDTEDQDATIYILNKDGTRKAV